MYLSSVATLHKCMFHRAGSRGQCNTLRVMGVSDGWSELFVADGAERGAANVGGLCADLEWSGGGRRDRVRPQDSVQLDRGSWWGAASAGASSLGQAVVF